MPGAAAYYSVIQYCPDRFRMETVNVGVVLYCAEPQFLKGRVVDNHKRLRQVFGVAGADLDALKLAEANLLGRINGDDAFASREDLIAFIAGRANDLRMTELRLVKVTDAERDFDRLFDQLVHEPTGVGGVEAFPAPAELLPPKLNEVFYRLSAEHKVWRPSRITVPVRKSKLDIPYAYQNGVVNLIKPHVFPDTKRAQAQAATLAVDGDLIGKHPIDDKPHRLIVVSTQETPAQAKEITEHVAPLFAHYGVRLIRPATADQFAEEVEQSAH